MSDVTQSTSFPCGIVLCSGSAPSWSFFFPAGRPFSQYQACPSFFFFACDSFLFSHVADGESLQGAYPTALQPPDGSSKDSSFFRRHCQTSGLEPTPFPHDVPEGHLHHASTHELSSVLSPFLFPNYSSPLSFLSSIVSFSSGRKDFPPFAVLACPAAPLPFSGAHFSRSYLFSSFFFFFFFFLSSASLSLSEDHALSSLPPSPFFARAFIALSSSFICFSPSRAPDPLPLEWPPENRSPLSYFSFRDCPFFSLPQDVIRLSVTSSV